MKSELDLLIQNYLSDVEKGMSFFSQKIVGKSPLCSWRSSEIPQKGELSEGVRYEFHGIGCLLTFSDREVDFDFGPDNRVDGFDFWRLYQYALSQKNKYSKYASEGRLLTDFEDAIERGFISKIDETKSKLYFKVS